MEENRVRDIGVGHDQEERMENRRDQVLKEVYASSLATSVITMTIVCILEVFMLGYTLYNPALFGDFIWRYRSFYISLLTVAALYLALILFVKREMDARFRYLNIANPLCAAFFFAWSLGIMYSDIVGAGVVDLTVFTTFSLVVPLSFFLLPAVYAAIIACADVALFIITTGAAPTLGVIINLSIFFIFQIVLGINYLMIKVRLAERIVRERENAVIDVMTGLGNRRAYEEEMALIEKDWPQVDIAFVVVDLNGLKSINDALGHGAGDRLIKGAAQCISECFSEESRIYRVGGDEFIIITYLSEHDLAEHLANFDSRLLVWSAENALTLSVSHGSAIASRHPGRSVRELARLADDAMYEAKARYYQDRNVRDRRASA